MLWPLSTGGLWPNWVCSRLSEQLDFGSSELIIQGANLEFHSGPMYAILCQNCRTRPKEDSYRVSCPICGGPLGFEYSDSAGFGASKGRSMWTYHDRLPVHPEFKVVSMGEGFTPLQKTRCHKRAEVYLKNETLNPTGSHKDRALSVGMSKALQFGYDTVMLYSDGSTSLASAAYAARAGIRNITLVPPGMPDSRLLPLIIYNSTVLEYHGSSAEALDWVHDACQRLGIYETSTYRRANPYQSEGPKTIAYEIFEQLNRVPDWVVVPVGGGATLAAIWRGFLEMEAARLTSKRPRMVAVLPEGYDILQTAMNQRVQSEKDLRALTLQNAPPTLQAKIAMVCPPDGLEVIAAINGSGGILLYASDEEALASQRRLGTCEGMYAEPSAAVSFTAVEKLLETKKVKDGETIVAVITGSGFRETGTISDRVKINKFSIEPDSGITTLKQILNEDKPPQRR
jgi:threonine synthase